MTYTVREIASWASTVIAIELARNLTDAGVRGNKFYLAARSEDLTPAFFNSGVLENVKGISSTKTIWRDFSPNAGRDILFVIPADEALKINRLARVGYTNPDRLIANNSAIIARVLSAKVAHGMCDNLIAGVFKLTMKHAETRYRDDPIAVSNMALRIAAAIQHGRPLNAPGMPTTLDVASFGDTSQGLRLNSYDDYANLYHQAAKGAGHYGKSIVKFFAPQNRAKWLPALKQGIVEQAGVYADEAEWVNLKDDLKLPAKTTILFAFDKSVLEPAPVPEPVWWKYRQETRDKVLAMKEKLEAAPFKVTIVDALKTNNSLISATTKAREAKRGQEV